MSKPKRDTRRFEYPDPTPVSTPVRFRGLSVPNQDFRQFMQEWSTSQAEANHVESFDEANDFEINDPEDYDFFHDVTPYEMQDLPEDTQADRLDQDQSQVEKAESNETGPTGADLTSQHQNDDPHDQSAPTGNPPFPS